MTVYLDFDDVLAETFRTLAEFAALAFGKSPVPGRETHFDLHESLGLGVEEYAEFMDRFHAEKLLDVDEIPGACETLRGWVRDGIRPVVVTGRPVSAHGPSAEWLRRRGLGSVEVLHVDKYARFPDPGAPGVVPFPSLRNFGFGLAVDDAPAALDALARSGLCPYVAFSRPWNASWSPPSGAPAPALHTGNWSEIDALARRLASSPVQPIQTTRPLPCAE